MKHRAALVLAPSLIIVLVAGLGMFSENLHARSERYGLAKIGRLSGEWGFPGKSLKSVHTDLGYHFERPGTSPRVLFIGDSHMEQYYPRIDKLFTQYPDTTKGVVFVTRRACPPISSQPRNDLPRCAGFMEKAASMAREPDIDTIVIASAWNRYDVFDGDTAERAFQDLTTTIRKYRAMGKRVYLVLPIPRGEMFDPSRLVIRTVWDFGPNIVQRINRAQIDCTVKRIATRLTNIAATTGAIAINPVNYLCPDGDCPTLSEDGVPIYGDESHLRPDYVREHVTFLDSILR